MLTPQIAASLLDGAANDPDSTDNLFRDALVTLHNRTVDALRGHEKMVEKAEPEFLPVAKSFRDLHRRHASGIAGILSGMGIAVDPGGTLMGSINETVVSLRALFDEIDEDAMDSIRNGENHVLRAFDEVLKVEQAPEIAAKVSAMREELVRLLDDTRHLD